MRLGLFANPHSLHTRRLVAGLARRGLTIEVMHRGPGAVPGATYEEYVVPPFGWRYPARWMHRRDRFIARFFRRCDAVGIWFLEDWNLNAETVAAGRLVVAPWGSDICPPPTGPQPSAATLARRREVLGLAQTVHAWGRAFATQVEQFGGLPAGSVTALPLGVDTRLFAPRAELEARPPTVGFCKGFGHAYGAPHLLRAIPAVVAAMPAVRFEMIGAGPLLSECQALAAELGVQEHIRWSPAVAHAELPARVGCWDVSVIPSVCESFGAAALEAAALEVPVVASNVGGLPETVLDGRTGLLVPVGDSAALAAAIVSLLRDEERRREMGRAGRVYVTEHYEWENVLGRWADFYRQAASMPRGPAAGTPVVAEEMCLEA